MSISPLNPSAQTGLVPSSLLAYSSNGQSALEITATNITLGGNLNTTPIYVEISASGGLQTTNPTGLDINCDFNMNQNDITNVSSIINEGNDLFINTGVSALDINITAGSVLNLTGDSMNILSPTGSIVMDSTQTDINGGLVNITATSTSVNVNAPTIQLGSTAGNIALTSNNNNIVLDANNDITLTTSSGVCNITSFDSLSILSLDSSVSITSNVSSLNLLAPTSEINMTATQATLTDGTGSTSSIAPTLIE